MYIREYFIMPVAAIAGALHAVGKAVESLFAEEKSTGSEESSANITERLIKAGDEALRDSSNSASPTGHSGAQVEDKSQKGRSKSAPAALITDATSSPTYESFPRGRANSNPTVGVRKSGWFK